MAERYTRHCRRKRQRKDVRLVEVPPALFTCTNTGSDAPSSTTTYDEQSRSMMMYDDTMDDFGNADMLTPTFPYRKCYETGRPFLFSQQQVVPSPGGKAWSPLPSGTPETMIYSGGNLVPIPCHGPQPQPPQPSMYKIHCPPPLDNLLPPIDGVTNSGGATGSSSSAIGDYERKYRETLFGLGPRFAAIMFMIIILTLAAIIACIVISQKV